MHINKTYWSLDSLTVLENWTHNLFRNHYILINYFNSDSYDSIYYDNYNKVFYWLPWGNLDSCQTPHVSVTTGFLCVNETLTCSLGEPGTEPQPLGFIDDWSTNWANVNPTLINPCCDHSAVSLCLSFFYDFALQV